MLLIFSAKLFSQTSNCVNGEIPERFGKYKSFSEAENNFCIEINDKPELQAIYGFVMSPKHGRIVRVYKDKAIFTYYEDVARYKVLELTGKEFENFQTQIAKINPETQPPIRDACIDMCSVYEFLTVKHDGGHRVFMFAQYHFPPEPMKSLMELFRSWESFAEIKTHYYLQEKYPEARVLLTNENYSLQTVWKNGEDMRVLVVDKGKPYDSAFSWRRFSGGKLGDEIEQPKEVNFLGTNGRDSCGSLMVLNHHPFQMMLGDYELCIGVDRKAGLWKLRNEKEIKIKSGEYNSPLVTPDQKWIVAAKGDEDKPIWKSIVRINTATNKEYKVNLPIADCFYPSAFVPVQNKVLIVRCKQEYTAKENNPSPDPPEFYLLDVETGKTILTKNEIRPLMHQDFRFLQPTKRKNEFWAAIPDKETKTTQIGRYDLQNLKFVPVMTIPSIIFYSRDLWVDDEEKSAYIVYGFQLLKISLQEDS
ncbi:MAG: hypothetical protein ACR2F2_13310 [Pyrinomonadaceae bacterium]